jgi:hypothetical protein
MRAVLIDYELPRGAIFVAPKSGASAMFIHEDGA